MMKKAARFTVHSRTMDRESNSHIPDRPRLTRREMLRLSAGSLFALGLWPGVLRAAGRGNSGEFTFLAINDVHYEDEHCGAWFEKVVRRMKATTPGPDFCLMAGDFAEHGKSDELAAIRDLFASLGILTYGVIGNHDYKSQEDRKPYEDIFPGRINYHFEHKGWQFVGLDTSEGLRSSKTKVSEVTLHWLDDNLSKLDKQRPTVILTHFPLGPKVTNRPLNADDLLERFKEYNLQAAYSGHFHGFTERTVREATLTTNRCCSFRKGNHDGTKEKGYFVCRAKDGKISRTFVEVEAPPPPPPK